MSLRQAPTAKLRLSDVLDRLLEELFMASKHTPPIGALIEVQRNHFAKLEKSTMFNPILRELIVREQYNDLLRQAEHDRLANAAIARQPAQRVGQRVSFASLLLAVRYMFKAMARAD
jgi:hypothetical protein